MKNFILNKQIIKMENRSEIKENNISELLNKNISKIKKDNILELLNNFIDFMKSNKKWKLLKWSNNNPTKDFIEDLNDILNEQTSKIWISLTFYKWSPDKLERTVSINYFINKKTMRWKLSYEYTFLNIGRPDNIYNFDGFISFEQFFSSTSI